MVNSLCQHFFTTKHLNVKTRRLPFARLLTALIISAIGVVQAAELRVMRTGLGVGSILDTDLVPRINCGGGCNESNTGTPSVTLRVAVGDGSRFTAWGRCITPVHSLN